MSTKSFFFVYGFASLIILVVFFLFMRHIDQEENLSLMEGRGSSDTTFSPEDLTQMPMILKGVWGQLEEQYGITAKTAVCNFEKT